MFRAFRPEKQQTRSYIMEATSLMEAGLDKPDSVFSF